MSPTAGNLVDLDLFGLEAAVGSPSLERGRAYARRGRVLALVWDPSSETLRGSVAGQGGLYDTTAFLVRGFGGAWSFDTGLCTCPVSFNCQHVAALVVAAAAAAGPARSGAGRRRPLPSRRGSGACVR